MAAIRLEQPDDIMAIKEIYLSAFPTPLEAELVDTLRSRKKLFLSLVASENNDLVGHIAFTKVVIDNQPQSQGIGLGPMAVLPARQSHGIGTELVRHGLEWCGSHGVSFVVVLGHPHYYPRFGFKPAKPFGITCQWEVPEEVFMLLELQEGALAGIAGCAKYEVEFDEA